VGGACGTHGIGEKSVQGFHGKVGKPRGKRPLRKLRHRWEVGIKMDLTEIGRELVEWLHLAQDRRIGTGCCEHGDEPSGSGAMKLANLFLVRRLLHGGSS
jgi:hypothetical protein